MSTHVVVLAAGQGKRMFSDLPKVAHPVAGRPMVGWVLDTVEPLKPVSTVVVVGHGADHVLQILPEGAVSALQTEQLGTGHATSVGLAAIEDIADDDVVVVLYGDTPLLTTGLVERLASLEPSEVGRLVTTTLEDPTGYGRILRADNGDVVGVVEEGDCTDEQRKIGEVNAGFYAIRARPLLTALAGLTADNAQGEYYLTDVVGILSAGGDKLVAVNASPEEVSGINSQDQLADARKVIQRRVNQRLLESGVSMLDPDRTYIDDTVEVAPGVMIYPGVHLEGSTRIGAGSRIGPDVYAKDTVVGEGNIIWYAVMRSAVIEDGCEVGPYASLRPGTVLKTGSKVGTFVETKNAVLGEGAKASHQAYLGDVTIGARTNIGAGAITVNYDGTSKNRTEIGEDTFIGSDSMLVAPLTIGDRAYTGAGSVITEDVPDDALAIERSEQKLIPDYSERRRARKARLDAED